MLKSSFTPLFSTIVPIKPRPHKFSKSISNSITQCPPPVRRNASPKTSPTSAYIHLPFCRKRCHYCDFPIVALGSSSNPTEDNPLILNYIQLLTREIKATTTDSNHNPPLKTVFFGGGTPSLVPPRLVSSVLDALRVKFGVCLDAEISMEMDPGTFDGGKMRELMDMGVNRVSLGVQAFQDEILKACGRAHGVKEVYDAIEVVGSCGVENWSIDLISSLPHQTTEMWEESLRLAVELQPKHVSVYDLQVEQGTKFGVLYSPGEFPLPSETQSADFYRMASTTLVANGYIHYEISSYSKQGFECKHNLTYWNDKPFYAFGLGSASYLGGVRFSRPRKMKEYMGYVQNLEDGVINFYQDNHLDVKDRATDVVMLSLRTARGLNLKSFREEFGGSLVFSLCEVYKPYIESGHVIFLDEERRVISSDEFSILLSDEHKIEERVAFIRLSDPNGFLLSNELISLAFGAIAP